MKNYLKKFPTLKLLWKRFQDRSLDSNFQWNERQKQTNSHHSFEIKPKRFFWSRMSDSLNKKSKMRHLQEILQILSFERSLDVGIVIRSLYISKLTTCGIMCCDVEKLLNEAFSFLSYRERRMSGKVLKWWIGFTFRLKHFFTIFSACYKLFLASLFSELFIRQFLPSIRWCWRNE